MISRFDDARGFFLETWNKARYVEAGLPDAFVQDNLSFSTRGVLRGLHFQNPTPQGKLVFVLHGEVFDVAVDIRANSPTFGQWVGVILSGNNKRPVDVPLLSEKDRIYPVLKDIPSDRLPQSGVHADE